MIVRVDAQLPPNLVPWLRERFGLEVQAVRDLGLREARDRQIFLAARAAGAVIMTKDGDFLDLLDQLGPPPSVLWITCGNTSNVRLKQVLEGTLRPAIELLTAGEALVEISDAT